MHTVFLGDGQAAAMVSDPAGGTDRSFQRLYEHTVPKRKRGADKKPLKGCRLSLTIRLRIQGRFLFEPAEASAPSRRIPLEPGVELRLWAPDALLEAKELQALRDELLQQMRAHGTPDRTFYMGKWHDNGGRTVLELAPEAGLTYRYGGKTTSPGQAFGPVLRRLLSDKLGPAFFGTTTADADYWAHLVFYPSPGGCGLSWHSDAEAGIDPHCIASITFLEHPAHGARPFQVRPKKRKGSEH